MKKLAIVLVVIMAGCATSSNSVPIISASNETISNIVDEAKTDVESFAHCMRYDENITLTAEEELALLEHCVGL